MDEPGIKITATVQRAVRTLADRGDIHAAELVKQILEYHKEYAAGTAREVLGMAWGDFGQEKRQSAEDWVAQLSAMFDPLLATLLHGRLAILGLCLLDKMLGRHLQSFTAELRKELLEDFESLLLPEHAGDEKYRRTFLKILQNRAKHSPDTEFNPRSSGFAILTSGGIGLETLAGLCFKQSWNRCLTARYQVVGNSGFKDFLEYLMTDLRGLAAGDYATIGSFLPEQRGNQRPGSQEQQGTPPPARQSWFELARKIPVDPNQPDSAAEFNMGMLFSLASQTLETGQRLVFFVEWRGLDRDADAESIGLNVLIASALSTLAERMGIVISGLPESIRSRLVSEPIYELELPEEQEPRRGQRLINDTPTGPDRLNIQNDVEALADAIALKEMSPPMVVGIFGGWGTGKSFVLHLIEQRLQERRCEGIGHGDEARQNYPFVGHPYLVHFDAWTYAKGNLWASLMQTILVELDRQISLERKLADDLGFDLRTGSQLWKALWQLTDKQRNVFTKTRLGEKALASVLNFSQNGSQGDLWKELRRLRKVELDKLKDETRKLDQLRKQHLQAHRELEAIVDSELAAEAQAIAWQPVWEELGSLVKSGRGEANVKNFDQMMKAIPAAKKLWLGVKNLSMPAAMFMVIAIASVWLAADIAAIENIFAKWSGVFVALGAPVLRAWEWFEQRRNAYEQRVATMMGSKDRLRQQRIDERINLPTDYTAEEDEAEGVEAQKTEPKAEAAVGESDQHKAELAGQEVAMLQARITDMKAVIGAMIRARVGITGQARSLPDFLKTRIEEGLYQKELGLLDQIQNDIQELSDTLLPAQASGALDRENTDTLFPRGDPRVVLFIDDLDRCPPDKVVEVLEAAQLLVKTQLFVVVIAIDVRYVTRALENQYRGVLVRSGEPSGLDYIEKIIQIPYRVRPVAAEGVERYLSSQMDVLEEERPGAPEEEEAEDLEALETGDSADQQAAKARLAESAQAAFSESITLPTRALEFDPEEYVAISAACSALPVSPRTMKRLVNVFKLLKIIWYRKGLESGPMIDVKRTMLSILALCSAFPEVLRKLLSEMDVFYRDDSNELDRNLVEFLVERCLAGAKVALYPPDWEQVAETIAHNFPASVSFGSLKEANLHLLISFSFVGETDSEREATLRRGFYKNAIPDSTDTEGAQPDEENSSTDPDIDIE
jgi:hypothetical protein